VEQPERFGKYVVSEVLGKGAMGAVYKAFDPDIRRPVAIKTIHSQLLEQETTGDLMSARFRHEAQAAGRLAHPGIVGVYEFGQANDCAYIAMEFVEGRTLRHYFANRAVFDADQIVSVMVQLLEALGHAHERGVWHRDIKPANLILISDGRVKIADFGIARVDDSELTQVASVMGTPGYIAPEMYRKAPVDHRADLFAAGVVMYEMLAGRPAFMGSTQEVMYSVCHEEPPPIAAKPEHPGLAHFEPVARRAMAKMPEQRFQSAAEFRDAILAAYQQSAQAQMPDDTLVSVRSAPVAAPKPEASAPSPAVGVPTGGLAWDPHVLARLEKQLAVAVGPLARVMVRRAAKQSANLKSLIDTVASELGSTEERQAFLAGVRDLLAPGRATAPTPQPVPARVDPRTGKPPTDSKAGPASVDVAAPAPAATALTEQDVQRAAQLLGSLIGPLSRLIVKSAAAKAHDKAQFYRLVAEGIPTEEDRETFLRDVRNAGKR